MPINLTLPFWVTPHGEAALPTWQESLQALQVGVEVQQVDTVNARHLRLHPCLSLILDENGLSLASQGMKMQPDWIGQISRLKRAGHRNELIARACQTEQQPVIIDATAGLGHDGLLLAWLGAHVTLVERHPVLFALLQNAFNAANQHELLAPVMQRIRLVHADAADYLSQCAAQNNTVDVVYLDPMFPKADPRQAKKQAQVKKEMQILHELLTLSPQNLNTEQVIDLGANLLPLAQQVARRVIVKRPRHALPLTLDVPQHQWLGDACRFDGYFQLLPA